MDQRVDEKKSIPNEQVLIRASVVSVAELVSPPDRQHESLFFFFFFLTKFNGSGTARTNDEPMD